MYFGAGAHGIPWGGTHWIPWGGPWDPRVGPLDPWALGTHGPWGPIGPWGPLGPLGPGPWARILYIRVNTSIFFNRKNQFFTKID